MPSTGVIDREEVAAIPLALALFLAVTATGCSSSNSLSGDEVEWVAIAAGSFMMGCVDGDPQCGGPGGEFGETPRHAVTVPAFEMTKTEITQYQYWKVTDDEPSYHPSCGNCPVQYMQNHYHDAKAFCEAIGGRLPSESEWEYAARAGTTSRFMCGDDPGCLDEIAWHGENSQEQDPSLVRYPQPVAQKLPNDFGLYDMTGNVQEWTEDCSHDDYTNAPTDGRAWMEEDGGDCTRHVFKGSTYNTELELSDDSNWMARPSGRYWDPTDIRGIADGFRCARDVE